MNERMKRVLAGACLVVFASVVAAAQAAKVDLTGKWLFTVTTDAGTGEPTVTLKQDGEKLTGDYSSQVLGDAALTGSVKGQQISFAFTTNGIEVKYTGTVENKDALKGTVDLGGLASGTFTAKRQ